MHTTSGVPVSLGSDFTMTIAEAPSESAAPTPVLNLATRAVLAYVPNSSPNIPAPTISRSPAAPKLPTRLGVRSCHSCSTAIDGNIAAAKLQMLELD